MELNAGTFLTINIAILTLFVGQFLAEKSVVMRRFSIPDPLQAVFSAPLSSLFLA